jgi:DNA-binding response OmpR family regulator
VEDGSAAAAQLCDNDGPRLVLLDWEMPELDGPSVCRAVRKKKDQGYVYMILLTSKGLKADVVAGLGAGADDYLTKPFDTEELKAACVPASASCTSKADWSRPARICASKPPMTP